MMSTEKYNGWTNYETWNVALWLGNTEGDYRFWTEQAEECYEQAEAGSTFTREEQAALDLADRLKEEFERAADELLPGQQKASVWADLIGAALSEVDWHEIAEHYIADVEKAEPEPDEE